MAATGPPGNNDPSAPRRPNAGDTVERQISELVEALSRSLVRKLATGFTRADTINITINNAIHLDHSMSTTSYTSNVSHSSDISVAQGTGNQATAGSGNAPILSASDAESLTADLTRLRAGMRAEATDVDHDLAVAAVAEAQKAAEAKDPATVTTKLRAAGTWALSIAEKLGLAAATEAIKRALTAS